MAAGAAVLMTGYILVPWSEAVHTDRNARRKCPCGCKKRDLVKERKLGYDRCCLRCFTYTWDADAWQIPGPNSYEAKQAETAFLKKQDEEAKEHRRRAEELERAMEAEADRWALETEGKRQAGRKGGSRRAHAPLREVAVAS
jgi:hypothetical protein